MVASNNSSPISKVRRVRARRRRARYVFVLFVAGMSLRSVRAIRSIKKMCEARFPRNYDLTVVDLYRQPELARTEQIVAAPTLVKKRPKPLRRLIGEFRGESRVLLGMEVTHTA
jgi:circadian clock protein KaiB